MKVNFQIYHYGRGKCVRKGEKMDTLFDCLKKGTAPEQVWHLPEIIWKKEGFEELYYDRLVCASPGMGVILSLHFRMSCFAFTMGRKRAYIQPGAHGVCSCGSALF